MNIPSFGKDYRLIKGGGNKQHNKQQQSRHVFIRFIV